MSKKNIDIYSIIGKRIKEEREKLSLTQEELATKAEIGTKFLSSIERNVSKPSLDTFIKIARALDIPCDYLINDIENDIDFSNYIKHILSDLSVTQQKEILNIIKNIKKLI